MTPNTIKIQSLSTWSELFNPTTGVFRLPSTAGTPIQHLEIDIRFVDETCFDASAGEVYLPNVTKLILRGGEYCQEDDARMEALADILLAINPVEVQWLHASEVLEEQYSFSTHLVHHAIIAVGQKWARNGLRKLVVQGGFPCPNLTPPTPYAVTPATTPCPSPGPHQYFSSLPALSSTKPKVDEKKLKERKERQRIAEYALKPRFEYAFGSWAPRELRWRLDGRYTPAAILSIISNLIQSIADHYPSAAPRTHAELPSVITFAPVPSTIFAKLQALGGDLDAEVLGYLEDVLFVGADNQFARLFSHTTTSIRGNKADELVGAEIVPLSSLQASPTLSYTSLAPGSLDSDADTDQEPEAVTPEMNQSVMIQVPEKASAL